MFQKFVHAGINPPLNYMFAPCSVTSLPARCSGNCYPFPPGATGRAPSFWLPLAGYARQHPERQERRAVPALNSRRIYMILVEEGMAEGLNWNGTTIINIIQHILIGSRTRRCFLLSGCGRCVSKVCSCRHKPPFELHVRTLFSYVPACTVFRELLSFPPWRYG